MIQIGRMNKLIIKKILNDGDAQLDSGESEDIFLPKEYVHNELKPGNEVEVFVFVNREGSLQATTKKPYATVGQFANLRVAANSSAGAFLDWGLPKDLLVPKSEQQTKMEEGKQYIVYIFLDINTNRIAASSKLDKFVDLPSSNYTVGETVDLLICKRTDLGYKAIVNHYHWGVIYENEVFQKLHIGQQLKGYIKTIREDLKIDISLQQTGYKKVGDISEKILKAIQDLGGNSSVTDKSPPEDIYAQFGVSKKVFKRAVGALYKKRLITIDADSIKLV